MSDILFETLHRFTKALYGQQQLAGVWLEKPLQTASEKTYRIKPTHLVRIKGDALIDCDGDNSATHEIIEIRGSIHPPFKINLRSLENEETKTITI